MTSSLLSLLPLAIATGCLLKNKSSLSSMGYACLCGSVLFVFSNGISAQNILKPVVLLMDTILSKASILFTVVLLTFLVNLILQSDILSSCNALANKFITNERKAVCAILLISVALCLDDYLICYAVGAVILTSLRNLNISKEKTVMLINTAVTAICCMSPISSWNVVLRDYINASNINPMTVLVTLNFAAILRIVMVLFYCFDRAAGENAGEQLCIEESSISESGNQENLLIIAKIIISLLGAYTLTTFINSNYSLLVGALCSVVTAFYQLVIKHNKLDFLDLKRILKDTDNSIYFMPLFLICSWTMVSISNDLLGLNDYLVWLIGAFSIPEAIMPLVIFIFATIFAYVSGSTFACFGMFIPLACSISQYASNDIYLLSVAAAISGSLFASNSPISDTMTILSKSTRAKHDEVHDHQKPFSLVLAISSGFAFIVSGALSASSISSYGAIIAIILSSVILISYLIRRESEQRIIYRIPQSTKLTRHTVQIFAPANVKVNISVVFMIDKGNDDDNNAMLP